MSTVIKVEDLSKQYRLGQVGTGSLAHDVNRWWHRMRGKEDPYLKIGEENDRTAKGSSDYVWALKDINFEVQQGEVLGIIGRNGAGKSTLLKILSKTTTPTTGQVKIKGRIASLLEVGTGFHPELSGRENIFLNGAILGMTRQEIKSKFDEIVDFAGVERYIDTPVKRYSSGMYVRLAFGVAAHLEPEILIVDEVLAVGDAEFQQKALGKMKNVSEKDGRTVLFVSHNMAAMTQLCTSCILMTNGIASEKGKTEAIITKYLEVGASSTENYFKELGGDILNQFLFIKVTDDRLLIRNDFKFNEKIFIHLKLKVDQTIPQLEVALRLEDIHKRPIFTIHEMLNQYYGSDYIELKIEIPENFLTPGNFSWVMCINNPGKELFDIKESIANFSILETGSQFAQYSSAHYGCVFSKHIITRL
jgi:lipopolysaccharide transport system ATP-binding protein